MQEEIQSEQVEIPRSLGVSFAVVKAHRHAVIRDTGRYRQVDSGWLGADERWTVSHLRTAIAIIQPDLAFAWGPRDYVQEALDRGEVKVLPSQEGASRPQTLYLAFADRDGAGPAVRSLAEMPAEQARGRRRADRPRPAHVPHR